MNLETINKWLDEEYGCSYTKLEELHDFYFEKYCDLKQENQELKMESEKLTQLWLDSQEKRRKAIEYLEQPYRDNFDYSKAELLNILQNGSDE